MPPLISVVTGTYNRFDMLVGFIESVRNQIPETIPYEFVICDGGSTDGTLDYLRQQNDVVLIEDGALLGAISAFTRAAKKAQGQFVLLANDDILMGADSIIKALVYLQEHPTCGAVAFKDNRPIPGFKTDKDWYVLRMPAVRDGQAVSVIYAQVGLFRAWLGNRVGWWLGANSEMLGSRVYAGDNFLSAKIWELGYTVDEVDGCFIIDFVANDELRQITIAHQQQALEDGRMNDSEVYYSLWGKAGGPNIPPAPTISQQDTPAVRVLYLPIYEPGWTVQKTQKRGLREALMRAHTPNGWQIHVYELDYLSIAPNRLEDEILRAADMFQPRIILTQMQSHLPITGAMLSRIRSLHPRASIINWNGDQAEGGLISPEMLNVLRYVDLQLTVNASVLPIYEKHGITAAYWQIGFEEPQEPLPDMPSYDVVWIANAYSESRKQLEKVIRRYVESANENGVKITLGLYGSGWENSAGNTLYDFAKTRAINRNAKIAIGTNEYPDSYGFFSNRVFETMAAGNCLYLQQDVPGIEELTGLIDGTHYVSWSDSDDLIRKIDYYLMGHENERRLIADAGTAFVRQYHSFDARVQELFGLIKTKLQPYQDPTANAVYLRYIGRGQDAFGIPSRTNERIHYQYTPGRLLLVDRLDVPYFLSDPNKLWELAEG